VPTLNSVRTGLLMLLAACRRRLSLANGILPSYRETLHSGSDGECRRRRWAERMSRAGRLMAGRRWLKSFSGKRSSPSYARWFAVDLMCAAK
jgi:hypothetical protein